MNLSSNFMHGRPGICQNVEKKGNPLHTPPFISLKSYKHTSVKAFPWAREERKTAAEEREWQRRERAEEGEDGISRTASAALNICCVQVRGTYRNTVLSHWHMMMKGTHTQNVLEGSWKQCSGKAEEEVFRWMHGGVLTVFAERGVPTVHFTSCLFFLLRCLNLSMQAVTECWASPHSYLWKTLWAVFLCKHDTELLQINIISCVIFSFIHLFQSFVSPVTTSMKHVIALCWKSAYTFQIKSLSFKFLFSVRHMFLIVSKSLHFVHIVQTFLRNRSCS